MKFTSSVQSLSHVQLFATPWIAAHQASLSITNSQSSLRITSIKSVMPSSHLILCRPLLLLPPIPPNIRVFSNESTAWGGQSTGVSALASFLPKKSQADLLQDGLVGSPCSPRDSQEFHLTSISQSNHLHRSYGLNFWLLILSYLFSAWQPKWSPFGMNQMMAFPTFKSYMAPYLPESNSEYVTMIHRTCKAGSCWPC